MIYFCFSENLLTVFCPDVIYVILICYVKQTMVRSYKRKTSRGNFGDKQLQLSLNAMKNGTSAKKASADFGVPHTTLCRHRNCKVQSPGSVCFGAFRPVLNAEFESELVSRIDVMERAMFGLNTVDVRRLVYEYACESDANAVEVEQSFLGSEIERQSLSGADVPAAREILEELSPKPKIQKPRSRRRKAESATIVTASPFKKMLLEKESVKTDKVSRQKVNGTESKRKKARSETDRNKNEKKKAPLKAAERSTRKATRVQKQVVRKTCTEKVTSLRKFTCCRGCGVIEGSQEDLEMEQSWIACLECKKWFHDECAEMNGVLDDDFFTCKACIV